MRKLLLCGILLLLIILSACNQQKMNTSYYFSFTGGSEHWQLNGYEIFISPEELKAGNGELVMKNKENYMTDFFQYEVLFIKNGEEETVHRGSVSGQTDISSQFIGTIEGNNYNTTLNDITSIFMVVKWWDPDKNERVEEQINLYESSTEMNSFLNRKG